MSAETDPRSTIFGAGCGEQARLLALEPENVDFRSGITGSVGTF
jgi:hypothetical protein